MFGLQITPPSFGSHFTLVTYMFLDELYIHIFSASRASSQVLPCSQHAPGDVFYGLQALYRIWWRVVP